MNNAPRLRPRRHLGVRPRQHAVPASRQSVAAGRRADRRVRQRLAQGHAPRKRAAIQKDYYQRYGTTMRGMMTEHGVHADDYLAYVHQIDHSPLEPNPAMGAAIAKLPGRKLILTNGSTDHADAVLARLGIGDAFRGGVRHHRRRTRAEAGAADLPEIPDAARRRSGAVGDVRGSRPQPRRAAPARHDHRAGGARRHARRWCARTGSWKAATPPMSIMSRTI